MKEKEKCDLLNKIRQKSQMRIILILTLKNALSKENG